MSGKIILENFASQLEAKAEKMPDFRVMTFENGEYPGEVLTYKDIVLRGRKVFRLLKEKGMGKGDVFCLVMRNQPEFIYSLYGAAALGAIMVPVDPRIKSDRLEFILNNSKSKGIIFSAEFIESIVQRVVSSGKAWISSTLINENIPVLRACITNYRTESEDIHALVRVLNETRQDYRKPS